MVELSSCQQCLLPPAGVSDLQDVRSEVAHASARWKDLGTSLRVHPNDLDSIQASYPHSPNDCLREMLLKWLKQVYDVSATLILDPSFGTTKQGLHIKL